MNTENRIIFENKVFRLILNADATPASLLVKATGEEMLETAEAFRVPLFSVTQERPYNNEVKLSHPNKRTVFPANRVRVDDTCKDAVRLIIGFEITPFEAVVDVRRANTYLGFRLVDFIVHPEDYPGLTMSPPPVSEFRILQLAVKKRAQFGDWLNVVWDERSAVCVMASSPEETIDSGFSGNARVLTADAVRGIRLRGAEAVLTAAPTDAFLDAVADIERDYGLPHGVESRRSACINASAYWTAAITPDNADDHIRLAKAGGFRMMLIYYTAFFKEQNGYALNGNYDYNDRYPRGKADVTAVLEKIKAAGITPGLHFLQTHIGLESRYVTPHADPRLHLTRHFTLSRAYTDGDTELFVQENPEDTVLHEACRILKFGGELFSYEGYTTERPYRFTGCRRGAKKTLPEEHPMGQIGGILDVSEFGASSCYLDQESDLQDEIADKLSDIFNAGFRFIYFDGSEGTNAPFGIHVPRAQYRVYKKCQPEPLFTEGAAKAHFGWHHLSGGNAFDIFPPAIFKEMIVRHPADEAPRMQQNFTRLNFGWWGFWDANDTDGGTQADLLEYGTSVAAAWDCPVTIQTDLARMNAHPRIGDILEVMRRWEEVRATRWLTKEQKEELRHYEREHTLLLNEERTFELVSYRQIPTPKPIRAFLFERNGMRYVVYWHLTGEGTLRLRLPHGTLCKELYDEKTVLHAENGILTLPVSDRRYLMTDASGEVLMTAFANAEIV